jgi:hypothetical protein
VNDRTSAADAHRLEPTLTVSAATHVVNLLTTCVQVLDHEVAPWDPQALK